MLIADGAKDAYLDRVAGFLTWFTVIVVLLSALAVGANRPVSWSLLSIFIALSFSAYLLLDFLRGYPVGIGRLVPLTVLFVGAIAWGFIQTLPGLPETIWHPLWSAVESERATISADPIRGHHHVMRLLCYGMIFWMGARIASDPYRAHNVLKIIAIFSTGLAVFGLYAYMTGENAILDDLDRGNALKASFVNRNSYATYAMIGFLVNIACYLHFINSDDYASSIGRIRNFLESFFSGSWIYAVGALLCASVIALTLSRAGAGAAIIALITFSLAYRVKGRASSPVMILTLLAIVGFVVFTLSSDLTERFLATSDENLRFEIYPFVIEGIMQRPLLGHGLGAFLDAFRADVPLIAASGEWDFAHNAFLENVYELGIPAAAAFYLALGMITWRLWRGTRERMRDREFSCLAFAAVLAVTFHSIFDFSMQMPATASLFALIIGMGWTQSYSERKSGKRSRRKTKVDAKRSVAMASGPEIKLGS